MATVISVVQLNMPNLDFHYTAAYATGVVNHVNTVVDGVTYATVAEVDWTYSGVAFASLFCGTGITASFANNTLSVTGGTVNAYFEGLPNNGKIDLVLGFEAINYSAVGLYNTMLTASNSDDAAFVATVLGGNDQILGSSSNDTLFGGGGNDIIDGGGGIDVVTYHGAAGQYTFTKGADGSITVADSVAGRDGADTLTHVEELAFSDYTVSFDLTSSQDSLVYWIYQAAYGRTPDTAGFRYWAGVADSTQMSATALADQFLAAAEFTQVYGANPSNTTYVTGLYTHVLGRAPDQAGLDYWVGQANAGMAKDALLVAFAVSNENTALVGAHASPTTGFWTT